MLFSDILSSVCDLFPNCPYSLFHPLFPCQAQTKWSHFFLHNDGKKSTIWTDSSWCIVQNAWRLAGLPWWQSNWQKAESIHLWLTCKYRCTNPGLHHYTHNAGSIHLPRNLQFGTSRLCTHRPLHRKHTHTLFILFLLYVEWQEYTKRNKCDYNKTNRS